MQNLITHIKDEESIQFINEITEEFHNKLARPLRIGIVGERNSGKSTLINHLCGKTVCEASRFDPTCSNQSVFADFGKMKIEFIDTFYSFCDLSNLEKEKNAELISSFDLILFLSKADQKYVIEQNSLWQNVMRLCRTRKALVLLSKIDQVTPFKNDLPSEPDLFLDLNYFMFNGCEEEHIIPICCNPDYNFDVLLKYIIEKLNIVESSIQHNLSYVELTRKLSSEWWTRHSNFIRKEKERLIEICDELLNKLGKS